MSRAALLWFMTGENQSIRHTDSRHARSSVASLVDDSVCTRTGDREKSMCAASATGISPARIILPCTVLELVLERRRQPHVGKSGKRVWRRTWRFTFYTVVYETPAKGHFRFSICLAASPLPESHGNSGPPLGWPRYMYILPD